MNARLSEKQRNVLRWVMKGPKTTTVLAGATRSGKTFAAAMAHAAWIAMHGGGFDHVLAGRTGTSAWRNAGETTLSFLKAFGCVARYNAAKQFMLVDAPSGQARLWVLGADNKESRTKVQGATLQTAHVDEAPLCHAEFLPFLWTRFSTEPARLIMTLNPEGPQHWFKRDVIDDADRWDAVVQEHTFADNPGLSPTAAERIASGLTGHWRARLVEGQWVGATGLVFPRWRTVEAADVPSEPQWVVGLDWGAASTTAAVLLAMEPVEHDRWPGRGVVVGEWVHDARATETLTDAAVLGQFRRWTEARCGSPANVSVIVDPATHAGFKRLLGAAGYRGRDGANDVLDGIATTDARLSEGNVTLLKGACPHLEGELATYAWDERAQARGVDQPLKSGDHAVDALRYACFTTARLSGEEAYRRREAELRAGAGGATVGA